MAVLAAHAGLQGGPENSCWQFVCSYYGRKTTNYLPCLSTWPLGCYMQFIQPMHQQPCVSHHQQVACVETHRVYPAGGFPPFGCWRGMIMEDDHDLDLQIF